MAQGLPGREDPIGLVRILSPRCSPDRDDIAHDPALQDKAFGHVVPGVIFTLIVGIHAVAGEYRRHHHCHLPDRRGRHQPFVVAGLTRQVRKQVPQPPVAHPQRVMLRPGAQQHLGNRQLGFQLGGELEPAISSLPHQRE